ncbi:hypothetical protein D8B26_003399 [Coccidioides posadasii str. Silveira]|uniref:Rhodopsin domain-containing protein n=2 Tax=Coccidioides posadasii TaxID=199306 RepID=E9CZQ8_COCPS|nr:hypothetical protein CPC735_004160 [Coccidioides posadasii C735 delta SOWgp]EER26245.1 hypothetical protein CPC735_004160 [Coccidioides posadasii C735 delta SOWgp]EFW20162.1 conserved hypothetical protein [Coccidioides posadasii str. Silveira]QVM08723.1 hypothetical protein D8B26_003399 [Coccidioides posadasii str. Silveira]|eukprot:XP_003068390.1 hypothetical protein CPC735_004160 [Coccidioides posadasii C735 delta SOWgp]
MPGGFHPPKEVMLSWPPRNYVNPEQRGDGVVILTGVFGVLMLIVVGLRLWVRFRMQREPGVDDYIIAAAVLPAIGLAVCMGLINPLHEGYRHIWDTPIQNFVAIIKLNWIAQVFFLFSNILTKISVLVLYMRVIKGTANKIFLNVVRGAIGILVAYATSGIVLLCLQCKPITAYWDQFNLLNPPKGKYTCWDEGILPLYAVIFNVFTDLMVTCLPMFLFVQLKMPFREKMSLAAVFGMGFIVCISGMIRIYYYYTIFYRTYDITWVAYEVWIWTVVECNLGIICASIPPLRPLFKRFLRGTLYGSGYPQNSYSSRSKNTTNPGDHFEQDAQSYHLRNTPRHTKSTEWDKDSNSSSMPLERNPRDGIMRTDNFEITYNHGLRPHEAHAPV